MANPNAVEEAPEVDLAAPVDLGDEIRRGLGSHPIQIRDHVGLKTVEIRVVADEAGGHDLVDDRLAQALDVHRAPRSKVLEAPPEASRAGHVLASPDDLVLGPDEGAAAGGALARHLPRRMAGRALLEDRADHLGDDLAALLNDD